MVERNAARSSAWRGLHLSLTFHVSHRSPPCKFFCDAICLILRRCGCGVGAAVATGWAGVECRTLFGVAGFAPKPKF